MRTKARQAELKRLKWYAKGMGVQVRFVKARGTHDAADWSLDGRLINIYYKPTTSMRYMVLSLIHELGHHKDFIENGRRHDILTERSMDKIERLPSNLTKKHRKRILQTEIDGTRYWRQIYRDTDCKFPIKYLDTAMDIDIWIYRRFYLTGSWPTPAERRRYSKDLLKKYSEDTCQSLAG